MVREEKLSEKMVKKDYTTRQAGNQVIKDVTKVAISD